MFSAEYYAEVKAGFDRQMALLDARLEELGKEKGSGIGYLQGLSERLLRERKGEILETLARCGEDEAQALTFLYSAMPLSDLLDYPVSLFMVYAKHGVYLWNQGLFAGRVPERLFANYVLHYRVNNEDIADTRGFFYDRIMEVIGGSEKQGHGGEDGQRGSGSMYATALEVNYWCAREATYRSTDGRTQNPRTMYGVTMGRCGEESTLGVTALRSIGIPARQIYAPLWTHCDDNHAWVEVWCDGEWHFLGACEPEEKLDLGWFIEPASRAMVLHSRWFGKDMPLDPQVGPKGMAKVLNHMNRYAYTTVLTVKAVDEKGLPVPGARLDFQVANHGELGSVALIQAGRGPKDCGMARLTTGFGDLYISASASMGPDQKKGMLYGEAKVSLDGADSDRGAECTVVLKEQPECWEGWRKMEFHAPKPCNIHDTTLTEEQQKVGKQRLARATEYRLKKAAGFYDRREAERVLGRFAGADREALEEILHNAHSNMGEIVRFLEWDGAELGAAWTREQSVCPGASDGNAAGAVSAADHWKLEMLKTLREKDYWDIKADVLIDCCRIAFPYMGSVPEDIFFSCLACPRVSIEMLRPCRGFLCACLDEAAKEEIRRNPDSLPKLVEKWIVSMPDQEYENLITSPIGCVRGGAGSMHSKEVLCVNIYRSLGIPARLNHFDGTLEYFRDGAFRAAGGPGEERCRLILREDGSLKLSDWEHYSLERFEGDGFRRLGLWGMTSLMEGGQLELQLRPGIYRILTVNRKKDGDQLAKMAVFALESGQRKEMALSLREVSMEGMLTKVEIEDFTLHGLDGRAARLSELSGGGKALFLWLEVTREPTEHILNELYERKEDFEKLAAPIYAVLKSPEDLENPTLHRTLEALPAIRPLLDDFGENYKTLARTVGREIGKLPLAAVIEAGHSCIYSDAGYNVGLADILWRILS